MPARTVYVASPLGFALPTRAWFSAALAPPILARGWKIADPWVLPAALAEAMVMADTAKPGQREGLLRDVNRRIGRRNEELIEGADAVMALLDGSDVDSGTAAEVGFAYARGLPVLGLRTDFRRSGDNAGTVVNLQVEYFIEGSGGEIVTLGPAATDDDLVAVVEALAQLPPRRR